MTGNKNLSGDKQRRAAQIEEFVIFVRLHLYNRGVAYGAKAIQRYLQDSEDDVVTALPSLSTINRILHRNGLTHGRTGHYDEGK
jgi:hypothetical protein